RTSRIHSDTFISSFLYEGGDGRVLGGGLPWPRAVVRVFALSIGMVPRRPGSARAADDSKVAGAVVRTTVTVQRCRPGSMPGAQGSALAGRPGKTGRVRRIWSPEFHDLGEFPTLWRLSHYL